MKRAGHSA